MRARARCSGTERESTVVDGEANMGHESGSNGSVAGVRVAPHLAAEFASTLGVGADVEVVVVVHHAGVAWPRAAESVKRLVVYFIGGSPYKIF